MAQGTYQIDLNPCSESYYFIPRPQYDDALIYLTSMAHEFPKPTYYVERYHTECYMLHFTLRGQGRFIYNDQSYTLKPGMLTFAYLGVHNILFPLTDDYEFCCFHVHGVQVKEIYHHVTKGGNKITMTYPIEDILPFFERLKPFIEPTLNHFEISKLLGAFLTDILRHSVKKIEEMNPLIHEINKLIVSHDIGVAEIAAQLNFSPVYLERKFKKHMGQSISSFIIKKKLEQAENLLITTSLSVDEIAHHVGYANSVGLVHLFRRHHDCTPTEFRKNKKNK